MSTTKDNSEEIIWGVLVFLTIIFTSLKMSDKIDWSWIWVFAPIWCVFALFGFFLMVGLSFEYITRTTNENYLNQFESATWYKLEDFPLQQEDFLKLIGYSKDWIDPDFNPDGTRECFINGDLAWTSARYVDYQDCYIEDCETKPSHFLIIPANNKLQ